MKISATINGISRAGIVTVNFNFKMKTKFNNLKDLKNDISVEMYSADESDQNMKAYTWEVKSFSSNEL